MANGITRKALGDITNGSSTEPVAKKRLSEQGVLSPRRTKRSRPSSERLAKEKAEQAASKPVDVKRLTKEEIDEAWASEQGLNGVREAPYDDTALREEICDFVGPKITKAEHCEYTKDEEKSWRANFKRKSARVLYMRDAAGDICAGAVVYREKGGWLYLQGMAASGGGAVIVLQLKAYVKADPKLHWLGADAVRGAAYEYWTLAMAFQPVQSVLRRICDLCMKESEAKEIRSMEDFRQYFKWEAQKNKYQPVAWYPFYG